MARPLNILIASSEVQPFAKTGGLADVCGALPKALAERGHQVRVILPKYRSVDSPRGPARDLGINLDIPIGSQVMQARLYENELAPGLPVTFVHNDPFFNRDFLYGPPGGAYGDNAARFIFFSRAVLEACEALDFQPDIVHCNDWQTGLVPVYLKTLYAENDFFSETRSVLSIHNLGYQGNFWHFDVPLAHLPWSLFTPDGIEFFGEFNFLKSGLMFADMLTTVSKTYSREILKSEHGFRLEGVLKHRARDLVGIVNGIDYDEWNPAHDGSIAQNYTARAPIRGKAACRRDLLATFGLKLEKNAPLFCLVTRLTSQKGLDLIMESLDTLLKTGAGLVVLGSGDGHYEEFFRTRSGDRLGVHLGFDEPLAHRILAGSDFLLMPSIYEPCGLTQMQAMKYGTVPVVSTVGGLKDTVPPFSPRTGKGLGFKFTPYGLKSYLAALKRAVRTYRNSPAWNRLVRNCMTADFSWDKAAREYERVYQKALKK